MPEEGSVFVDLPYTPPATPSPVSVFGSQIGGQGSFSELMVGAGARSFKADRSGWWLGANKFADAPAKCDMDGNASFSNVAITGGSISGALVSSVGAGSLLNIQGWSYSGSFSASDTDTVAWSAGNLTMGDGTTFAIAAGNTGNIAAITYIYFDKAVSLTVLQTTTTNSTAVGANKIMLAVAKNETGKSATFQAFGGKGIGQLITADNIASNTITTNEIAANTITANNIAAGTITATQIATNTLTVGTNVNLGTAQSASQVTTIIGNTVTTGYVNALGITAGSISASNVSAGTLTAISFVSAAGTGPRFIIDQNNLAYYDGSGFPFFVAFVNGSGLGDIGDFRVGGGSKYMHWDQSAGTLSIRGTLNADDIVAGTITGRTFQTAGSGRRVILNPAFSNFMRVYSDDTEKGSIGLDTDDNMKMTSVSNDIELRVPSSRSIGFFVNGTREMLCNGDGDFITRSNNTNQVGTSATRWKEMHATDIYQNGSHLDVRDDLAIINASKPRYNPDGSIMLDENGNAKLDHYSMPDWLHNGNELRAEIARKKPEIDGKIKEAENILKTDKKNENLKAYKAELEQEYQNYDITEDEIVERTSRNLGLFVDLVAGAVRQLDKKVEDLVVANKLKK